MESVLASLDLLLQSSQSSGSQPEQINPNSQVSDTSEIHRMTLKYSDDEVTDEELRKLNLQTAAHQYMMHQDAQNEATPTPFQKSQVSPQGPVPSR